jgi:phage tail protein X
VEGLGRSVRLIVGLGMVAAGTTLAAPTALVVAEWAGNGSGQRPQASPAPAPTAEWPLPEASVPVVAMAGPVVQPGPPAGWLPEVPPAPGGAALAVRESYQPPPPPAPLPPPAGGLAAAGPDLSVAYRSTLEVPPPPLIDGQRPPPLTVGWTARGGREPAPGRRPLPSPAGTYRVRDGDDLTAIASRFYGTPAAARLIWEANRGRLADPAILPIGIELVLPHPAAESGLEPAVGQPLGPSPPPVSSSSPWLGSAS